MTKVASRELRNNTRALLDRVAAGETITITVGGHELAVLVPVSTRSRFMTRTQFIAALAPADAGLLAELRALVPDTTDDLRVTDALADTTVFIARESGRPLLTDRLPDAIAVSVVTIGELRAGVLAASDVTTRDRRLATLTGALALDPLPIDAAVAASWARLRIDLRDAGSRMPVNDSWIAATALANGLALVTQDDDYLELPGLEVIRV